MMSWHCRFEYYQIEIFLNEAQYWQCLFSFFKLNVCVVTPMYQLKLIPLEEKIV